MHPVIVYIGDDAGLFSQLTKELRHQGYELQQALPDACRVEELLTDWFRLLIFDVDVAAAPGLDLLRRLKGRDAGIPVIVLGERHGRSLTRIGVARQNGVDRFFFRRELDMADLTAAVHESFRRLEYWKAHMQELAASSRVAAATCPMTG